MTPMRRVDDPNELRIERGYWYLGSPYSLYPRGVDAAFNDIRSVSDTLLLEGIRHYSPIYFTHKIAALTGIDPLDADFWMWADQPYMDRAHGMIVAALPGWESSKGVLEERRIFTRAAKPTFLLDPLTFQSPFNGRIIAFKEVVA